MLSLFIPFFFFSQLGMLLLFFTFLHFRLFIVIFSLPLFVLTCLQWANFGLFRSELSEGGIASILSADISESAEFIASLPLGLLIIFILLLLTFITLLAKIHVRIYWSRSTKLMFVSWIVFAFFIKYLSMGNIGLAVKQTFFKSHPLRSLIAFNDASNLLESFESQLQEMSNLAVPLKIKVPLEDQVHLLVIGESVRKKSWSLYGYDRKTNSQLEGFGNRIFLFQDFISSDNTTIPSLLNALTLSEEDRMATLMDVAEAAGFETFWLSNQPQFGVYENPTSLIARRSDNTIFTRGTSAFDHQLLAPFEEIVRHKKGPKLIILHLMGSHGYYHLRYPLTHKKFDDCKGSNGIGSARRFCETINSYDNSISYTDELLAKIINLLDTLEVNGSVFYISDHGENLYDFNSFAGHGSLEVPKVEVEIPAFIWLSEPLKKQRPQLETVVENSLNDKWSLFHFFPSYLYLIGIEIDDREKKNLFESPMTEPRFVFDPNGQKHLYRDLR